jgi:hypothetical protein
MYSKPNMSCRRRRLCRRRGREWQRGYLSGHRADFVNDVSICGYGLAREACGLANGGLRESLASGLQCPAGGTNLGLGGLVANLVRPMCCQALALIKWQRSVKAHHPPMAAAAPLVLVPCPARDRSDGGSERRLR